MKICVFDNSVTKTKGKNSSYLGEGFRESDYDSEGQGRPKRDVIEFNTRHYLLCRDARLSPLSTNRQITIHYKRKYSRRINSFNNVKKCSIPSFTYVAYKCKTLPLFLYIRRGWLVGRWSFDVTKKFSSPDNFQTKYSPHLNIFLCFFPRFSSSLQTKHFHSLFFASSADLELWTVYKKFVINQFQLDWTVQYMTFSLSESVIDQSNILLKYQRSPGLFFTLKYQSFFRVINDLWQVASIDV